MQCAYEIIPTPKDHLERYQEEDYGYRGGHGIKEVAKIRAEVKRLPAST